MKREDGFTLIELMSVIAIVAVLLTLGVTALRYFWLGRALTGERDQIFSELRGLQQRVVSESNPYVFGAWFKVTTPSTDDGSAQWGTVRYVPAGASPGSPATCSSTSTHRMDGGVKIRSASFSNSLSGVSSMADVIATCKTQVPASALATDFAFFLARGTATSGCVILNQPRREMDDVAVSVSSLTGRVTRLTEAQAGTACP